MASVLNLGRALTPDDIPGLFTGFGPEDWFLTQNGGDTFIGYFLATFMRGRNLSSALDLACQAAAISVTRRGAAESIPFASELAPL